MIIPSTLIWRQTASGDGRRGYAYQRLRDDEGYGVELESVRQHYGSQWVQQWTYDWLPDASFPTLNALQEAVGRLSEDAISAERAKYPYVRRWRELNGRGLANTCAVCAREHPEGPVAGVVEVYLAQNWRMRCDVYMELCSEHRSLVDDRLALALRTAGGPRP